jgi:hypothetical protein
MPLSGHKGVENAASVKVPVQCENFAGARCRLATKQARASEPAENHYRWVIYS